VASSTFSPAVALQGLVANARTFSLKDLKALPAETVQVSYQAGQGTDSASFTGTRLLNVFDAPGGAKLPADMNNAKLRVTVMVTAADGYQVAFGWGELDPEFGAAPILLAYARDGQPMGENKAWRASSSRATNVAVATCRWSRASSCATRVRHRHSARLSPHRHGLLSPLCTARVSVTQDGARPGRSCAVIAAGALLLAGSISWGTVLEAMNSAPAANALAVASGRLPGAARFQLAWLDWDAYRLRRSLI
jgi:hypothetical protein